MDPRDPKVVMVLLVNPGRLVPLAKKEKLVCLVFPDIKDAVVVKVQLAPLVLTVLQA
jgi:hypothetical protein